MGAEVALFKPDWLSYPSAPADLDPVIWMPSFTRTESGELEVDGTSVSRLVADFGTPEYVFSETTFRARAAEFRSAFETAFEKHGAEVSVYYAGKSFLATAVAKWAEEEGLCLDTASGGELAIAMRAGVPGAKIALHGNNKSAGEIARALRYGVGRLGARGAADCAGSSRAGRHRPGHAPRDPGRPRLNPRLHCYRPRGSEVRSVSGSRYRTAGRSVA